MPRRSSGGRSAPRAPPRRAVSNPPAPVHRAPPPAPVQGSGGSMLGGIGSTIAQGMAFGTGSAVAHRAVDSVMGPRTIQHETVASQGPERAAASMGNTAGGADSCNNHSRAFQDCLNNYGSDITKCQPLSGYAEPSAVDDVLALLLCRFFQ
uniref:CHCH domain-containing protein n=1 Tax=Hyacinthus orientalis TaxID=82025 RepID=Q5YJM4_HYAOR|nr:unknown [Hyacinthus orientalis]